MKLTMQILSMSAALLSTNSMIDNPKVELQQINHINDVHEIRQETRLLSSYVLAKEFKKIEEEKQREATKQQFINNLLNDDIRTMNLNSKSGLTAQEINKLLEGTEMEGLGEAFVQAEQQYGINALYFTAHAIWESGWGISNLAKKKNNLFGFKAYDHDSYGSAETFSSKSECILKVAQYIKENYLTEGGKHYNGANLIGMNIKYSSDKEWADGIAQVMKCLVYDLKNA